MAVLKKNQVNQILFTMVDKTDFVTLETSLASNFTIKRIGVNHGSGAAAISTVSRVPSKVGSGIYRLSLEAANTNYDYVALRIAHASALTQMLVYEMRTYDDTDVDSKLVIMSGIQSDIYSLLSSRVPKAVATASRLLLAESVISDAHSAAAQANSRALVTQSVLSGMSNILSAVYVDTTDISNVLSNAHADLADLSSITSNIYSLLSSRVTKETANASQLLLVKSLASDAHSAAAQANSRALVTQSVLSGISDILSAVYVDTADISNILSNTHADLATMSGIVSDIYSLLSSRVLKEVASKSLLSDVASDLASHISGITVTIGASDVSDIVSALLAGGVATQSKLGAVETSLFDTRSKLVVMSGIQSDIYSLLSSRVPKEVASKSLLSDVNSNLLSYLAGISDILSNVYVDTTDMSNILSNTHADLANMSGITSDIYSLLSSRVTKEVANASQLLLVKSLASDAHSAASAIKVQTDKLTFTIANQVDANMQYINDTQLTGDGELATPWGPV